MNKTVSFDDSQYRLVPLAPSAEMLDVYKEWHRNGLGCMDSSICRSMIEAVPADLPGVVETDTAALQARIDDLEAMVAAQAGQEPVAYRIEHRPDRYTFMEAKHYDCNKWLYEGARFTALYATPPAPASLSLVQAALEAAAKVLENGSFIHRESPIARDARRVAELIRAIDPQQIIDEVSK